MIAVLNRATVTELHPGIAVTGSKSESNRLLLLQALYPAIQIKNLSESDDTVVLQHGLKTENGTVDVHHAGTAMRFLTAYFAVKEGSEVLLTGSDRMHERPIKILVDALRKLGAHIEYVKEDGFPPLRIFGKKLLENNVSIDANVSSQYISALMLIAPSLPNGLRIQLKGTITSIPYIEMTLSLLKRIGVNCSFSENVIRIAHQEKVNAITMTVESDWSSASYFYSLVALNKALRVTLTSYHKASLQGDSALVLIYKSLGVVTVFNESEESMTISNNNDPKTDYLLLDLVSTPDIAQTIAVTCFGLGMGCRLSGLHTLKIKETDRLSALKNELEKLGGKVAITSNTLELKPKSGKSLSETKDRRIEIETYQDHRMAMAFAPLGSLFPIAIKEPMVVTKSFPSFWSDMVKLGIAVDFK
jgi:3-phosphoshikimate 1-carboxyvinyltransferase